MELSDFNLTESDLKSIFSDLGIIVRKETRDELICICPFHQDTKPSFRFSKSLLVGNCFSCGTGVNLFSLVKEISGMSLYKFLGISDSDRLSMEFQMKSKKINLKNKSIKNEVSIDEELKVHGKFINPFHNKLAREYCISRGISVLDTDNHNISYMDYGTINGTIFQNRLVIPIYNEDGSNIISFEGRDVTRKQEKKVIYPYKSKTGNVIYNQHLISPEDKVIFVEGIMDVLAVQKVVKEEYKVSTAFGIQFTHKQAKFLNTIKDVTFLYDSDDGGRRGISLLHGVRKKDFLPMYVAFLDEGDPGEAKPEEIKKALTNKMSWEIYESKQSKEFQELIPMPYEWK